MKTRANVSKNHKYYNTKVSYYRDLQNCANTTNMGWKRSTDQQLETAESISTDMFTSVDCGYITQEGFTQIASGSRRT
jgi:hypothetical protein